MSPTTVPALLRGLVSDAAVFPPGDSPLPDAVATHARHRSAPYADAVGPLLVPGSAASDLLAALDRAPWSHPGPLRVGVVARPGSDPGVLCAGLVLLESDPRVDLTAAQLGWTSDWRRLDLPGDLPIALEVPREPPARDAALADVRDSAAEGDVVIAKFRTGPTPTWPWPDERETAAFLVAATRAPSPYTLTGGLHHAVRGRHLVDGRPEQNHGVLNVLVATAAALDGAGTAEVAALLAVKDARTLADLVLAWPEPTVHRVRAAFVSFGCCTVTDPLGELAGLGLPATPEQHGEDPRP